MALRIKKLIKGCPQKNSWLTDKIEVVICMCHQNVESLEYIYIYFF